MNFYWLYFIIPCILYFIRPIKNNKLLFWYWAFIVILSYDNVTDFFYYYEEFFLYKDGVFGEHFNAEKVREPLWIILNKLLGFTDYGVVIIHILVMTLVVYYFARFSKKFNIVNASVFLFFLLNYIWKTDNIVRQDIAIVLGTIALFEVIENTKWTRINYIKIILLTVIAIGFHFSAFMLLPMFFLVKWFSNTKLNIPIVTSIIVIMVILCQNEMIQNRIAAFRVVFDLIGGKYGTEYTSKFVNLEMDAGGRIGIFLSIFSVSPLIYYRMYRKKVYENNKFIRICVNLSWLFVTWKSCINMDLFTRPIEYLSWFSLWGFAFMLNDMMLHLKKQCNLIVFSLCFAYFVCSGWSLYSFIGRYYGDNNYMTVLSKECYELRIYTRNRNLINEGFTRYR